MRIQRIASGVVFAALAVLGLAGPVTAGKQVPFRGCLEGSFTATIDPGPPPIGTLEGSGVGQATHLGRFTYEFPHEVNFGVVPPQGKGKYTFTAANGDMVFAKFTGFSKPVEPGFVLVTEEAVITGGTGRFRGASGAFTVVRLVDQVGGTTIGEFEGTISAPGPRRGKK